jgi:hypothetical protein
VRRLLPPLPPPLQRGGDAAEPNGSAPPPPLPYRSLDALLPPMRTVRLGIA